MAKKVSALFGAFALVLCVGSTADAQVGPSGEAAQVFPVVDSHGSVYQLPGGGTLITATGQASAIGFSDGANHRSHVGWLRAYFGRVDIEEPEIFAPDDVIVEQENLDGAEVELPEADVLDNADPNPTVLVTVPDLDVEEVEYGNVPPLTFPLGETQVFYTAVDRHGNMAHDSMLVTVVDTTPPSIELADARITIEAEQPEGSLVDLPEADVEDACDADAEVTTNAPGRFPVGETEVVYTATDSSGNSDTVTLVVEVVDTTPPTIDFGQALFEAEQTDHDGARVDLPAPLVRDNGTPTQQIVVVDDAPAVFPLGRTVVTFVATDSRGNSQEAQLEVEVQDHRRPQIELVDAPESDWSNQDIILRFRVSDECDANPTVGADPAPNGVEPGGGDGVYAVQFEDDGLYDVTLTAEDTSGNQTSMGGLVFGIETQAPTAKVRAIPNPAPVNAPHLWPLFYRGEEFEAIFEGRDGAGQLVSGLSSLNATLVQMDLQNGDLDSWVLYDEDFEADGVPARGPARAKDLNCDNLQYCTPAGQLLLDRLPLGAYRIEVEVQDVAGNSGSYAFPFHVSNLLTAIATATESMTVKLGEDPGPAAAHLAGAAEMLGYDPAGNNVNAYLALEQEFLGNTLLYLQDVVKLMQMAHNVNNDVDTSREQNYLTRGAAAETRLIWTRIVLAQGGGVRGDAEIAEDHLNMAEGSLANEAYGATYLDLRKALFFTMNHDEALRIWEDLWEQEAVDMNRTVMRLLEDYLDTDEINGKACVATALDFLVQADELYNAPGNWNRNRINLMIALNSASDTLHNCIPEHVYTRYWQWGVVQVVKSYVQLGRYNSARALGCGDQPDDPICHSAHPLMGEASCRYASGLALFDTRDVDEALDVYVNAKCLMVALYNYAFAQDAVPMPDDCDGVELFECFDPDE